jgi:hypothetical protein
MHMLDEVLLLTKRMDNIVCGAGQGVSCSAKGWSWPSWSVTKYPFRA